MTTPAEISKLHMEILSELSSNSIKYYIPDNCHILGTLLFCCINIQYMYRYIVGKYIIHLYEL